MPFDEARELRQGIEDNLRTLRTGQLAAVNLRLPGDGRVDARFDDQLAAMVAARDAVNWKTPRDDSRLAAAVNDLLAA